MEEIERVSDWLESLDFSGWRLLDNTCSLWLKLRDEEPFEYFYEGTSSWIYALEQGKPLSQEELDALDRLGEVASSKALEATSNSQIAECVGEDFELLARAVRLGLNDGWLKSLHHMYQQERFPFGTLGGV